MPGAGVALDGVGERIQAGVGGDTRRQADGQAGIDDGEGRHQLAAARAEFALLFGVGEHQGPGHLAARAAGGGDGNHLGLAQPQGFHGVDVGGVEIGALVERPDGLGRVHGAAAAQADDPVGAKLGRHLGAAAHGLEAGFRLHLAEGEYSKPASLQDLLDPASDPEPHQVGVGHDQGALALDLLQVTQRIFTIHNHR